MRRTERDPAESPTERRTPGPKSPRDRRPWSRRARPGPRLVVRPFLEFLGTEASGGIFLLVATAVALAWANSPWAESYDRVWHTRLSLRLGSVVLTEDLRHWISEALMTLFFFVVGLEIKRELAVGELRHRPTAMLPVAAAVGGMLIPAGLYLALNHSPGSARGWGIPMATDIAFSVGVLSLMRARISVSLPIFLLGLAIVDDIGAIIVIAVFYSGGIEVGPLLGALAAFGIVLVLRRLGVRSVAVYFVVGTAAWLLTRASGIHPTIAGVGLGLLTPVSPFQPPAGVSSEARRVADETVDHPNPPDRDAPEWMYLGRLSREAAPPSARLLQALHPWTSFLILPLFALANAGIDLADSVRAGVGSVAIGVAVGLVVGKTLGVTAGSLLAARAGWAEAGGIRLRHLAGTGAVAGIGFTVALFVANLAFEDPKLLSQAKLGIIAGSVASAVLGVVLLSRFPSAGRDRGDSVHRV